jgi:Bacterial PH domain
MFFCSILEYISKNPPNTPMGLLSNLLGNATEIDIAKVQAELEPVLAPGESIGRGFKIFRDMFIFTDHRLIMIDKQGLTRSKVTYHSILYRNITPSSVSRPLDRSMLIPNLKFAFLAEECRLRRSSRKAPMWSAYKNT